LASDRAPEKLRQPVNNRIMTRSPIHKRRDFRFKTKVSGCFKFMVRE